MSNRDRASSAPAPQAGRNAAAGAVAWSAALRMAEELARRRVPAVIGGCRASRAFAPAWDAFVGAWTGDSTTAGLVATFAYELGGDVLTHRARGPSARDAEAHDILMTFYPRPGGQAADAFLFDNAGQAMPWEARWSGDARALVMNSVPEPGEPRWRLTWRFDGIDTLATCLESTAPDARARTERVRATLSRAAPRR